MNQPPPFGSSKGRKTKATKLEKKISAEIGAKYHPGSGKDPALKGDFTIPAELQTFLVDLKSTEQQYTVRRADLEKLTQEARLAGKVPVLVVEITSPVSDALFPHRWAVIPFHAFYQLFNLEEFDARQRNSRDNL